MAETGYRFPIYRANEYNLRKQIMEALQYLGQFPVVKTSVEAGDIAYIPSGSQLICYESFTIDAGGWINVEGELVILGGAYRDEHAHSPYKLDTSAGLYEIDGASPTLAAHIIAQLDAGSYSYSGSAATLTGP